MKKLFATIIAGMVLLAGGLAMASQEPHYKITDTPAALSSINAEMRFYDEVLIASVRVQGDTWRDAASAAFRPLANYIFGANAGKEKIGMTTPVTTHRVTRSDANEGAVWEVRFFMPPRYNVASLPAPESAYVRIEAQQAVSYAAIRFSGSARNEKGMRNFALHEDKLRKALRQSGLADDGVAHYAVYNGPWTPSVMRRNEVLIALP